jgi:hypothetical protein
MDNKLKLAALKKAMEKYGEALVIQIVQELKDADKVATGNLAKSIDYELVEALDKISINISGEKYLSVVDGGRRKGAKPPPTGAIIKWMKVKGIQGRNPKTGRFQSQKSTAFAIARGISKNGIKPTFVIKKSLRKLKALQAKLLTDAAVDDMTKMIQGVFLVSKP